MAQHFNEVRTGGDEMQLVIIVYFVLLAVVAGSILLN
jgi:hypothetical protein